MALKNNNIKLWEKNKLVVKITGIMFLISIISVLMIIYDIGFEQHAISQNILTQVYFIALISAVFSTIFRYLIKALRPRPKAWVVDFLLLVFYTLLIINDTDIIEDKLSFLLVFKNIRWIYLALFLFFIRDFSALKIDIKRAIFNPAQLFIISFFLITIIGGLMLMLPNATKAGISLIDALFTSTSAVCVTGLVVVDTGTYFTDLGQIIIIVLIQLGGLGIMTFASYFSYFFRGNTTFQSQLFLNDMTNAEKMAEVFSVLKKIIILTFLIEALGAFSIYYSLDPTAFSSLTEKIFFSIFHSVSGFCNAGFSTLSNGLFDIGFRFNYPMQLIIAILIILGGIGFPIIFNISKYLKYLFLSRLNYIFRKKTIRHYPWIININTRIVLITTLILLISGTVIYFITEYNNTLSEHSFAGKIATSFFCSVTARTAGFNTVDFSAISLPTTLIIIILMWIGASPGSTGGGIKTSTLAVAFMNIISLAKSKSRIEVYGREISDNSIRRAFAIIVLSIVVIGTSIFLIAIFDYDKGLLNITFECFSAYSTVGLSRGITPGLSEISKLILIITMFIGRVSMLTVLIAIFKKASKLKYRYPTEEILIN